MTKSHIQILDHFTPSNQSDTTSNSPNFKKTPSTPSLSPKAAQTSSKVQKRTLNTLAARRYRQKRVDQVAGLEDALKETQSERDALKVRVARLEGEVEVLRGLLKK